MLEDLGRFKPRHYSEVYIGVCLKHKQKHGAAFVQGLFLQGLY